MNILFISLLEFNSIEEHSIYTDLLRKFKKKGHKIYSVSPIERRKSKTGNVIYENDSIIIRPRTGNIQKTNFVEKGVSTIILEHQIYRCIKKHFDDIKFDLVLFTTPPVTLIKPVKYIKKRDNAITYLMLKDIFPQGAVDLEILSRKGIKGLIYKFFRRKEKQLYNIADYIGCMSKANIDYILSENSNIKSNKLELCPNCIDVVSRVITEQQKKIIREKYHIPIDKIVLVYGGNIGKPQGVDFLVQCLNVEKENEKIYFLIVGEGTEVYKIEEFIMTEKPKNVKLLKKMPKEEYDLMIASCDIGMIFLDYRFTIPNFPSRLLGYMQAKLAVLACTDPNTDIGRVVTNGDFGWWCESNNPKSFRNIIDSILNCDLKNKKERAYEFLKINYNTERIYDTILRHIDKDN